jgi:leucyl-tRNA synthetase
MVINKLVKKVGDDIEAMKFNTAISALMIAVNELEKTPRISRTDYEILLKLLSPFAPHVAEELWSEAGNRSSVMLAPWPKYDHAQSVESMVKIIVQVNGKVRGSFETSPEAADAELETRARALPEMAKWLNGTTPKKVIVVKNRLVNFVV